MNQSFKYFALNLSHIIPDKLYIKTVYRILTHKKLNLKDPQTYNEKLNWLKLHYRKDIFTKMADKAAAADMASDIIGADYVPKRLALYNSYDEIDFSKLPEKFVLKCTHDGGSVCVCSDKNTFDYEKAKNVLSRHLKRNAFFYAREWPYKNIKPQIIAEEYLEDGINEVLPVYKIFCFSGEPKIIQAIHNDKHPNETVDYFDADWNWLDLQQNYPKSEKPCEKPSSFEQMLDMSRALSKDLPHIRIDFYEVAGKPIFSEFTFYNDAGICAFKPENWDKILGDMIVLPEKTN